MAVGFDSYLGVHDDALRLRTQRAEILAANLANADTPNYKAKDIDFQKALKMAQSEQSPFELKTTNFRHIHATGEADNPALAYRQPTQPSLDGNTVETHIEQAEFSRNSMGYMSSLTFLGSKFKSLLGAVKGE